MVEFFERNNFRGKSRDFSNKLLDKEWVIRLSYLDDIFTPEQITSRTIYNCC